MRDLKYVDKAFTIQEIKYIECSLEEYYCNHNFNPSEDYILNCLIKNISQIRAWKSK